MREARTYLGLELAGARNSKTTLAVLESYPKEGKVFLLDLFDRVTAHDEQTADEALLELIGEFSGDSARNPVRMAVNVATELPPCLTCTRRTCPGPARCTVPAVKWMRMQARKSGREFTPYTQRPVELWLRNQVLSALPPGHRFEIDETMGGNRAPLTARMHWLKRHLTGLKLCEALPKLTVSLLALKWGISRRTMSHYRDLEKGEAARHEILEQFVDRENVFIYERDLQKLARSLACFDAFVCAFTAMLADQGRCVKIPAGFPEKSGWVECPA